MMLNNKVVDNRLSSLHDASPKGFMLVTLTANLYDLASLEAASLELVQLNQTANALQFSYEKAQYGTHYCCYVESGTFNQACRYEGVKLGERA